MIVSYKNSYMIVNSVIYDLGFMLQNISRERRDLFKKGVFQIKREARWNALYVNDRYVGGWSDGQSDEAETIIGVAYRTYTSVGGKI